MRSNTLFTLDRHASTHALDYRFADAKAKTTTCRVCFSVFFQVAEVDEKGVDLTSRYPASEVLDLEQKLKVVGVLTAAMLRSKALTLVV